LSIALLGGRRRFVGDGAVGFEVFGFLEAFFGGRFDAPKILTILRKHKVGFVFI